MGQDVDLWIRELKAAGWIQVRMTVWKSPSGYLFRGPHKAWEMMHAHPALNVKAKQAHDSDNLPYG